VHPIAWLFYCQLMMLLERGNVLTALWDHLALAACGQGRLVLLRGEAGAGKTAVLGSFADRARSVADVLVGGCDPLSTPRPLGPLIDVAAGLGAAVQQELERTNGGPSGVTEVFRCVMDALGCGRPQVLIFEDVHWADEATLDLMCLLGRRIERQTAMLVASYRDDEIGPSHRLRVLLGNLAGVSVVHRCAIEPLSPHGVARLAAGRRIDIDELYRVTAGNPFFVTEVLAVSGDGIPATVAEAVAGRMGKVSPAARGVAEVVAVIGSRAPVELVTALCDEAADTVEELLGAGLLQAIGGAVGFRHELARMAVLDTIPDFRRTALHAQVLDRLRADPTRRDDHSLLAHHAELAGDHDAVLAHAPPAGAHAAALGAHREAAEHYGRAVRCGAVRCGAVRCGAVRCGAVRPCRRIAGRHCWNCSAGNVFWPANSPKESTQCRLLLSCGEPWVIGFARVTIFAGCPSFSGRRVAPPSASGPVSRLCGSWRHCRRAASWRGPT
jgi:predicted ATPase